MIAKINIEPFWPESVSSLLCPDDGPLAQKIWRQIILREPTFSDKKRKKSIWNFTTPRKFVNIQGAKLMWQGFIAQWFLRVSSSKQVAGDSLRKDRLKTGRIQNRSLDWNEMKTKHLKDGRSPIILQKSSPTPASTRLPAFTNVCQALAGTRQGFNLTSLKWLTGSH